jgi:transcriptional regulator with XRE-family HTH domain
MNGEWFASRLKELRERVGLSQKELADKARLSHRAISHWEQGVRQPRWSNVVALAEALGVDCRAFLVEPGARSEAGRGRPPKAPPTDAPAPKRPRGRPRKAK